MRQYKYFLFDWDGTLAKTLDIWLGCLKESLVKKGHHLSDADIGANYNKFKDRFESLGHKEVELIVEEAAKSAESKVLSVELYKGARETLEFLYNNGNHIGLVTTSAHEQIDPLLKKHSLDTLFEVVICGDDVTDTKPNPEPILKAIDILNADPYETAMIGDSESDIKASANAMIDSILFYPPSHKKYHNLSSLKLLEPSYVIYGLPQLKTLAKI